MHKAWVLRRVQMAFSQIAQCTVATLVLYSYIARFKKGQEVVTLKISVPQSRPAPALPTDIAPDVALILEHYPGIGEKIRQTWGSIELQRYLTRIIIDERGGRQGFPPPVASAMLRIYTDHSKLVPEDNKDNLWRSEIK